MKRRSYALIGALAVVIAAAVLVAVLVHRPAPKPVTEAPQPTEPSLTAAEPVKPPTPAPQQPAATAAAKVQPATPAPTEKPTAPAEPVKPAPLPAAAAGDPAVRIDSPSAGSRYRSSVVVAGTITDTASAATSLFVESASWSITGTDRAGPITLSPKGSFRATVSTEGLHGELSLVVSARKKSGGTAEKSLALVEDTRGPALSIASPRPQSSYGSSVTVSGRVSGPEDAANPLLEISSATWAVDGTTIGGPLDLSHDGSFSVTFSTVGMHGDITMSLVATDRNGHAAQATLSLNDRASGPSLRIDSPADKTPYADTVSVSGIVGDPHDPSDAPGEVRSVSWRVIGMPKLAGDLSFSKEGAFRFSFPTAGVNGAAVLELQALDKNGRTATRALTLVPPAAAASAAAPVLTVSSPVDNSVFGSVVTVAGTVTAAASDPVASVAWSIAGTPFRGSADVGAGGGFSFPLKTAGLHGTQALNISASSASGLTAQKTIVLMDSGKGIQISLSAPVDGGYYRDLTVFDGRVAVGDDASQVKSFAYEVIGVSGLAGRVAPQPDGRFKFVLSLGHLTGDVKVRLNAQDVNSKQTQTTVLLHDGNLKPAVTISAPTQGSAFGSLIRVAGAVKDPFAGRAGMEGIDSLAWLVSPVDFSRNSTPARGTATLGQNGVFKFSVPTKGLSGPQTLTLTVVAKSGNRTETTVRLIPGDGDLPGFTVTPSDRKITVTWDTVPFAQGFDLSYAQGSDVPDQGKTLSGVKPPVTLSDVQNGLLYSLVAKVRFDDGGSGASPVTRVIPLSAQTLLPTVKGDYQQIKVDWSKIPGADAYEVWRSGNGPSGYEKIAPSVAGTSYVDSAVEFGKEYSYQIAPAGPQAPRSASVSAKSLAFPVEKLAEVGATALSQPRRVTVNGGYVFVASGERGMRVIDISDPRKPTPVSTLVTDNAWAVAVRGDYAYIADGESGLRAVDMSAPRTPVLVGTRKTSDARAVVLAGTAAYVADGTKGLKVIDISDAQTLERIGTMETTNALDLVAIGTRLFLADGEGGLKIINIARPRQPVVIATLATSDARAVAVEGGIAVVADGAAGLRIVDVKDPLKPSLLATFDTGLATSVSLESSFAYVTDGKSGIKVVDLTNPSRPALFTSHAAAGAVSMSVVDHYAYIADTAGLEVMRVQIQGKSFKVASAETNGKAFALSIAGNFAYVSGHAAGVRIIDVSDPSRVRDASLVGSLSTRFAESVTLHDSLAYIADGTNGLRIVDVSPTWAAGQAKPPLDVGSYKPGGVVNAVAVAGTTAYLAAGEQGVQVLDVSAPASPASIGSVQTKDANDILVRGSWGFVADGEGGLLIIDVSTPARPKALPVVYRGSAKKLALTGNLLMVSGTQGVTAVDVTDPAAAKVKGTYETSAAESVAVSGSYAYVAEGYRGLTVLDITHPEHMPVVSACDEVFAVGVGVKGNYAIVVDSFGLRVIQILIPEWLMH